MVQGDHHTLVGASVIVSMIVGRCEVGIDLSLQPDAFHLGPIAGHPEDDVDDTQPRYAAEEAWDYFSRKLAEVKAQLWQQALPAERAYYDADALCLVNAVGQTIERAVAKYFGSEQMKTVPALPEDEPRRRRRGRKLSYLAQLSGRTRKENGS